MSSKTKKSTLATGDMAGKSAFMPEGVTVNLNARLFAAVAMFRATHDIRYYLNGVYVESGPHGGAVICASDGRQLALAYDAQGTAPKEGLILPVGNPLVAAARRGEQVAIAENRLRVYAANLAESYIQAGIPLVEGKFPEWHLVVPRSDNMLKQARGSWSSALFGRLTRVGAMLSRRGCALPITHWQEAPREDDTNRNVPAILTRFESEPYFLAVTMPMRVEGDTALPAFYRPIADARDARRKVEREARRAAHLAKNAAATEVPA